MFSGSQQLGVHSPTSLPASGAGLGPLEPVGLVWRLLLLWLSGMGWRPGGGWEWGKGGLGGWERVGKRWDWGWDGEEEGESEGGMEIERGWE